MVKNIMRNCTLCPRNCHADRTNGEIGYCGQTDEIKVARAALHMWEEPCISGDKGSGTVFFSGCTLGCVYCQNYNISRGHTGKIITIERLGEIFLELEKKGSHNINLVTPDHFIPQIIEAIDEAKKNGFSLPVVCNSSSYIRTGALKLLEGYVDIYLPDLKYMEYSIGKKYSDCEDYFKFASQAIREMVRQVGEPAFDENGIMKKGVIVRHLTLPGCLQDSKNIIKYLYETFGDSIYISIMNQFTPLSHIEKYTELNRKIRDEEYDELVDYAVLLGVNNGFIQEGETSSESFIPDFNCEGV